jgi:hypothetical protein
MSIQPLSRSLAPLTDESMAGFVLRLSHRLRMIPSRLAVLTGLVDDAEIRRGGRIPGHRLLTLDPTAAAAFATATCLTPDEVAGLCLDRFADRYPPLNLDTCWYRGSFIVTPVTRRGWVLLGCTRYCPQCLGGDGSPIQHRHGGAWRQQWRLQVVFACTTHRRILQHLCPQCGGLAGATQQHGNVRLVSRAGDASLHPAQCRNQSDGGYLRDSTPVCGARLTATTCGETANTELLELQDRILQRLQPDGPIQAADAAQYFSLLSLVHTLVVLTWPMARDLTKPAGLAGAVDDYVAQLRHQIEQMKAAANVPAGVNALMTKLPVEPKPCAGLLLAADTIVNWKDLDGLKERITPFAEQAAASAPRAWYWLRTRDAWPDSLRQSLVQQVHGFTVPARPGKRPPIPPRECRFIRENIPQRLPDTWCNPHLPSTNDLPHKHLRRAMALKLVELTSGHAWSYAAELLEFPRKIAEASVFSTRRWMRDDSHRDAFNRAAEALAQHLDTAPALINYATRRHALRDWIMPTHHWQDFAHELREQTRTGRGRWHKLGGRKREIVSIRIWTQITEGEHLFSPLVLADKQAHVSSPSRTATLAREAGELHYPLNRNPDAYSVIRRIITAYAEALATHIDHHGTTTRFDWNPASSRRGEP